MEAPKDRPANIIPPAKPAPSTGTNYSASLIELILSGAPKPPHRRLSRRQWAIAIVVILLCLGGLVGGLCAVGLNLKSQVLRIDCESNLRNIAAACINYADKHGGNLPGSMAEVCADSGMTPIVSVCPASSDEPATGTPPEIAAKIAAGHNVSYIYVGDHLTMTESATAVVAYDRPGNHSDGINVLFGDFHVGWVAKKDEPAFLKVAESGARPVYWPQPKSK